MATVSPDSMSSSVASSSSFSVNGSPTCTCGRRDSLFADSSSEAKLAPWIPSRPVREPMVRSTLPTPWARARMRSRSRSSPTHIAFTSGFPLYPGANATSPPSVGTPTQLP